MCNHESSDGTFNEEWSFGNKCPICGNITTQNYFYGEYCKLCNWNKNTCPSCGKQIGHWPEPEMEFCSRCGWKYESNNCRK
jgi:predicted amidophosphoribosyltransferase